jgi:HK97 family phage major capsid protein
VSPLSFSESERIVELASFPHRTVSQRTEYADLVARQGRSDEFLAWCHDHPEVLAASLSLANSESIGSAAQFPTHPRAVTVGGPGPAVANARALVGQMHNRNKIGDRGAETLDALLTAENVDERWRAAEMVSVLGSEDYARAFAAVLRDPVNASAYLQPAERDALARGRVLAMEVGTGADGGYAVPLQLDPAIMLSGDGTISPIRQLARTVTGIAKEYDFVTSAGVTVEWAAEGAAASDNSPTLAQPTVKAIRQQGFVPFSMELEQDCQTIMAELGRLLRDASNVADAAAFISGVGGTTGPEGIVTALAGGDSEMTTATASTLILDDIEACQAAVPPRFRSAGPSFVANLALIQAARHFEVVTGVSAVQGSGADLSLIGDPLREASDMDSTLTAGSQVLISGAWQNYVIYDRLPTTIEVVPHLVRQATAGAGVGMPTGQRGLYMMRRVGAVCTVPEAFRLLTIKSS